MARVLADPPTRWRDLRTRILSALVLAPVALACLWVGGVAFDALVIVLAVALTVEWVQMCGGRAWDWPWAVVPAFVLLAALLIIAGQGAAALATLVVGFFAAWWAGHAPHRFGVAAGVPYVGAAMLALLWMRADAEAGRANLIFVLLLVWSSDIGAYLAGRALGGPRLAPRISPGKTWSGAVGGLAAAVGVGVAVSASLQHPATFLRVAAISACFGLVAQAGDLFESRIKRHFGVKDSGRLIPGHGGVLDRLDALLAVAPIAAILALAAGRGVVLWQ